MKNYFKTVILLLGISLLLWNCDNDSEIIDDSNHLNSKVKMIHQNFDFIKNNSNLLNKLSSLSKSKNVSSKSIEVNDFIIFTNNVTYTSHTDNNTEHTYSFYIKRKGTLTNNTVENLILKYQDGVYKSYILKYYFPQGIYNSNESFELINVEEIDDLSDSILARGCYNKYEYIAVETKHDCASGQHSGAGEQGSCAYTGNLAPYSTWSIQVVVKYLCDDGESGSGGIGGGTGSDTGSPSGGSTPPDNPSTTIDTGITLPACQTDDCGDAVNTANQINSLLEDSLNDQQLIWLFNNPIATATIESFLNENSVIEVKNFTLQAIDALIENNVVDFEELYIETLTPDDDYVSQSETKLISNPLVLNNGDQISITFGVTKSDNKSANQQFSIYLIDCIKSGIENANNKLTASEKITSIHIMATTNGKHSATSNHSKGTAVDISRINGEKMSITGITNQIKELQKAFDDYIFIRENFGPHFKHKFENMTGKWNYNYSIGGHSDHIHMSVRK